MFHRLNTLQTLENLSLGIYTLSADFQSNECILISVKISNKLYEISGSVGPVGLERHWYLRF